MALICSGKSMVVSEKVDSKESSLMTNALPSSSGELLAQIR